MLAVSDFLLYATVVEMADTGDLKSPVGDNVPVQVGSVAPLFEYQHTKMKGTKYYEFYYQSVGVLLDRSIRLI